MTPTCFQLTFKVRALPRRESYAKANSTQADGATLDDLREAVTTLEDTQDRTARVLGGANPITEVEPPRSRMTTIASRSLRAREAGKTFSSFSSPVPNVLPRVSHAIRGNAFKHGLTYPRAHVRCQRDRTTHQPLRRSQRPFFFGASTGATAPPPSPSRSARASAVSGAYRL